MTAVAEPPTLTLAPLSRRLMSEWPAWKTADEFARRTIRARIGEAPAATLERLEANIAAAGAPEGWWYEIRGGVEERLLPAVLTQFLAGLRLQEDAIPDLCRALVPSGGSRRGWMEQDLSRRVARGDMPATDPARSHAVTEPRPARVEPTAAGAVPGNGRGVSTIPAPAPPSEQPAVSVYRAPEPVLPPPVNVDAPEPEPHADPFEDDTVIEAPPVPTLNGKHVATMEDTAARSLIEPISSDGLKELLEIELRRQKVSLKERLTAEVINDLASRCNADPEKTHRALREIREARGIRVFSGNRRTSESRLPPQQAALLDRLKALEVDVGRIVPDRVKRSLAEELGTTEKAISNAISDVRKHLGIEEIDRSGWRKPSGAAKETGPDTLPEYVPLDLPKGSNLALVWEQVIQRRLDLRQQICTEDLKAIGTVIGLLPDQVHTAIGKLRKKQGLRAPAGGYRGHVPPHKNDAAGAPPPTVPAGPVNDQAKAMALLLVGKVAAVAGDDKDALMRAMSLLERVL